MPLFQFKPLEQSSYEVVKHSGCRHRCRGPECHTLFDKETTDINTYVIEVEDNTPEWWCVDCVWKYWRFLTDEYIHAFITDNVKIKTMWLNQ